MPAAASNPHRNLAKLKSYRQAVIADNPTYYYLLNETSGTLCEDERSRNDLTYNAFVIFDQPSLVVDKGNAVNFWDGGVNEGQASGGSYGTMTFPVTLEAWVSIPDGASSGEFPGIVATHQQLSLYDGFILQFVGASRTVGLQMGNNTGAADSQRRKSWTSVGTIPIDTPTHIVAIATDFSTVSIYFNGVLQDTTFSGTGASITYGSGVPMIGRNRVSAQSAEFIIDQVAVYDGIGLTEAQIQNHYDVGRRTDITSYAETILASAPTGWYRLNEKSGTSAFDSSGNDKTGTWVGTTNLGVDGLVHGNDLAAIFDGSTSYVNIPGANYNVTTEDFAIEMWIQTSQNTGNVVLWDKRDNGNNAQGWMASMVSGKASLFIKDDPTQIIITGTIDIADGRAHHLVFNYDRSALGEMWVDGVLDNSGSITTTPNIGALTTDSRIGTKTYTPSTYVKFNGTLDEVAFYKNKVFTSAEIIEHYYAGL